MTSGAIENGKPVLIAGGGIGGLSAAIALARKGIASCVLEAEPSFSESGAGVQIGPNGSRILRDWGLENGLETGASRPERIDIGDGRQGGTLTSLPLRPEAEQRYGAPYYVAERRYLHKLLIDHAAQRPEITLKTGFRVESFRRMPGGIAVMSSDSHELEGRALIGADGVHSRMRLLLYGVPPVYSGRNAWRATAAVNGSETDDGKSVNLWLGRRAHLVHYACNADGLINAVAITGGKPASDGWGTPGESVDLMPKFAGWTDEPWRFLRRFESWTIWPLLTMAPLPRWSDGRVTLLGDAAHPLMPFLASGAVMAIEDAAVLASEMARTPDNPERAFQNYEQRRIPRIRRVRRNSAAMGNIYQMGGPMRLARNLTLRALSGRHLLARNDWLYGYRVED